MELQDWKRHSLNSLFSAGATRNPMHTAVVFDDGQCSSCLTYGQLLSSSMAISDELRCGQRCEKEVIGVLVSTGLHLPTVLLGILGVPAAFYTLSVELSAPARMKNIFERLGMRIVVTDSLEFVDGLKAKIFRDCSLSVSHLNVMSRELLIVTLDNVPCLKHDGASSGSHLAYVITTSGTTGIPKIVKVPHQCIVPNILHISSIYGLTGSDTVLQASPLTFDPSIVEIFTTFFSGATLLIIPDSLKLQPRKLASLAVERNKVTVLQATPSLVSSMASSGVLRSTLLSAESSVRLLVFGGESCPNGRTLESWRQPGNRTRFINLYGITEVSSWATFYELTEDDVQSHIEDVPLGAPLLATELEIRETDDNSVGQLWIGGEDRMCLINDETHMSGQRMKFSGDYVRRMHAGALLYVGRKDDMVKRNGRRLHLHEIEKLFSRAVGINKCIAVYERKKLMLFVQPSSPNALNQSDSSKKETSDVASRSLDVVHSEPNSNTINGTSLNGEEAKSSPIARDVDCNEMKAEIERKLLVAINKLMDDWLPHFSRPDDVHFVWNLPLTNHGKVNKRKLIEMYGKWEEFIAPAPHLFTDVEISDQLTRIWKKYFTSDAPELKSFVESGGNSVMAVAITEDLHRLFGIDSTSLLDIVLHGTLQNVLTHVILAFKSIDNITKAHNEHDSDDAIVPVDIISVANATPHAPRVLLDNTNDLLSGEPDNLKRPASSALMPGKRTRRDDVESCSSDLRMGNALGSSIGSNSEDDDGAVVSVIQRGSRSVYYPDSLRSVMSCAARVDDVVDPTTLEMEVCWRFDTGKCVDASSLIVSLRNGENIVYIGSHSHRFIALNVASGSVVWEVTLGDRIESSACLSHCAQHIIVGCYDGKVYFLERLTGRQHWSFQTGSQVKSSPCINATNGLVYVGSHDHHLYALSAELRSCVWKTDLGGASIYSSPLINMLAYEVVVATLRGHLVSLHPDTGDVLWRFDAGKPMFSSVAYTGRHCVVGCVDGAVYCIGKDGEKIWSYTTGGAVFSSPCISDVIFPKQATPQTSKNAAYSCKPKPVVLPNSNPSPSAFVGMTTEDVSQQFVHADSSENHPSEKNKPRKVVTIGSHDSRVYCLCADNGGLLWSRTLDSAVFSTPFPFYSQRSSVTLPISSRSELVNSLSELRNSVAVCGSKGLLYILDLASGLVLFKFQLPGELFSSPCVVGDRLIVGCRDNFVYCIKLPVSYETS